MSNDRPRQSLAPSLLVDFAVVKLLLPVQPTVLMHHDNYADPVKKASRIALRRIETTARSVCVTKFSKERRKERMDDG